MGGIGDFFEDIFDVFWDILSAPFEWLGDLFEPEIPEMPDMPYSTVSPTYSQEKIVNTMSSGSPIPIAFGRVKVGGNVIRTSKSETTRAFIIGLCEGEIYRFLPSSEEPNSFGSPLINDIPWEELNDYNLISNGEFNSSTEHWYTSRCGGEDGQYSYRKLDRH